MSTWLAIGEDEGNGDKNGENTRTKPQPLVYLAGLDFSRTKWGLIFAGPVILGSLGVTIGLRMQSDRDPDTREIVKKVMNLTKELFSD